MLNYGFYNMNCMDGMREFPDKFFDIAVVDPPYFAGPNKRRYYGRSESTTLIKCREYDIIDTWDVPGMEYFDELIRVSRHQIVWGCNYFDYHFGSGRIVWDKCRSNMTFSDAEIAYCSLRQMCIRDRYDARQKRRRRVDSKRQQKNERAPDPSDTETDRSV